MKRTATFWNGGNNISPFFMKVILTGYEGSKHILAASSWLLKKYLPEEFDVYWLNYGLYTGRLETGTYVPLDNEQLGGSQAWSSYLREYLERLDDDLIILGLDDYLINDHIDMSLYTILLNSMVNGVVCGRLCDSSFYKDKQVKDSMIYVGKNEYTVTTQWCIWKREALLEILWETTTPWNFEINGTDYFNGTEYRVTGTNPHALKYADHSALSSKWEGINTAGLKEEDVNKLKKYGFI